MLEWKLIRLGDICKTNENSYYPKDNWKFVNYLDTGSLTENKITELQYINTKTDCIQLSFQSLPNYFFAFIVFHQKILQKLKEQLVWDLHISVFHPISFQGGKMPFS